jgi:hypothetical protein
MFAFSPTGYSSDTKIPVEYPLNPLDAYNSRGKGLKNRGGFLGVKAILDAANPWDIIKGFARSIRWLVIGRRHREDDPSYKQGGNSVELSHPPRGNYYNPPITEEFRRSKFGLQRNQDESEGEALFTNSLSGIHADDWEPSRSSGSVGARELNNTNEMLWGHEALGGPRSPQRTHNNSNDRGN